MCTLTDSKMTTRLLELIDDKCLQTHLVTCSIHEHSLIWPGYTSLHFAAHCNVQNVKMLINEGANLLAQDAKGTTPLEICVKMFNIRNLHCVLSRVSAWQKIVFSDGKTNLLNYVKSLRNPYSHKRFLESIGRIVGIAVPRKSPLWPGQTILHIAVILLRDSDHEMIHQILTQHADVTVQDCHGSTPLHWAFREEKWQILELLLKHHHKTRNSLDDKNLSHLHIAASVNNFQLVKKLLKTETTFDVAYNGKPLPTVKPGWTPLHTAAHTKHMIVVKTLLQKGANLFHTDTRGFTVVHNLLGTDNTTDSISTVLFGLNNLRECTVEAVGLTHLHVAVWKNKVEAIEQLLDRGSNVEATIGKLEDEHLKKFEGCRPIHVAMMDHSRLGAFEILLRRGADIFAKKLDEPSPFFDLLTRTYNDDYLKVLIESFWSGGRWQKKFEWKEGMNMMHLVCYALDYEKLESLVLKGVDVNARVRDDSEIWPGYTPLHVLTLADFRYSHPTTDSLFNSLLRAGADVTVKNAEGDTPAHMAMKACKSRDELALASFLIENQRKFNVNPINKFGVTHFHLTCILNDIKTAKEFLKYVDVNQRVKSSGQTPLHCALSLQARDHHSDEDQVQMINLLLERGADVHAVDELGSTPLHMLVACTATRNSLFDKILVGNADINKRTVDGTTPMEILLSDGAPSSEIKYFVDRGARINSYNSVSDVGYMAFVIASQKYQKLREASDILRIMMESPDITVVDSGRNAIHNAVAANVSSSDYYGYDDCYGCQGLIEKLIGLGCNIFQQDSQGRTALHLAVKFQNQQAITALLECGADINIIDLAGKSPLAYALAFRKDKTDSNAAICEILARHINLLQYVGLQVSTLNVRLLSKVPSKQNDIKVLRYKRWIDQSLVEANNIKICNGRFTLRDFLCRTSLVNMYSKQQVRDSIDSAFKSFCAKRFLDLQGVLKLQYRSAQERSSLLEPAKDALRRLMGCWLPDLCADIVLMYLTNLDMKNMTVAAIVFDDRRMVAD